MGVEKEAAEGAAQDRPGAEGVGVEKAMMGKNFPAAVPVAALAAELPVEGIVPFFFRSELIRIALDRFEK